MLIIFSYTDFPHQEITKCPGVCGNGGLNCARKCLTTSVCEVSGVLWYSPMTLTDLYTLMSKHKNNKIRLVAGNSGKGIQSFSKLLTVECFLHVVQFCENKSCANSLCVFQ